MAGSIPDRLEALLGQTASGAGLDLEEVTLSPAGKRRVLRIAVDQDGGVTLDDITRVSTAISTALDASDVMGSLPYTLEVGSRGSQSPLTAPRHWRRNTGYLVTVTLADGQSLEGRITDSSDTSATLMTTSGDVTVAYADVDEALVQFELNRKGV